MYNIKSQQKVNIDSYDRIKFMMYIFIDESGDTGNPEKEGTSSDFSMSACICDKAVLKESNDFIVFILDKLKRKEIKYSKLSKKDKDFVTLKLKKLDIKVKTVYFKKKYDLYTEHLLKYSFDELICKLNIHKDEKVKIIVDGLENSYYRKLYSKILDKYFDRYTLYLKNSQKTPMLQVADFYAGLARVRR